MKNRHNQLTAELEQSKENLKISLAFSKSVSVIRSCTTPDHLDAAEKYIDLYNKSFGDSSHVLYHKLKNRRHIVKNYFRTLENQRCMVVSNEDVPVQTGTVVEFTDLDKPNQLPLPLIKYDNDDTAYLCMGIVLPYDDIVLQELNSLPYKERWNRCCKPTCKMFDFQRYKF